jgi:hypothetical protein
MGIGLAARQLDVAVEVERVLAFQRPFSERLEHLKSSVIHHDNNAGGTEQSQVCFVLATVFDWYAKVRLVSSRVAVVALSLSLQSADVRTFSRAVRTQKSNVSL